MDMEKRRAFAAPNLMKICVDRITGNDIAGRIYCRMDREPSGFSSSGYMLLVIDELCDRIGCPQPAVISRTFSDKLQSGKNREAVDIMSSPEVFEDKKGEEATFVLHIKYRQNATWQGDITWAEENKSCSFRSALELLKLIDSAMNGQMNEDDSRDQAG